MEKTQNKKAEEFKKRVLQVVSVRGINDRLPNLAILEQHCQSNRVSSNDERKLGDIFRAIN